MSADEQAKPCVYCGDTQIDPMCTTDTLAWEEPCDPPHPCPACTRPFAVRTISFDEALEMLGLTREDVEAYEEE